MTPLALAAVVLFAPAADPPAVAGRWVSKNEFVTVTSVLLPDGRYFAETKVGDTVVPERGKWTLKGKKLTLDPQGGTAVTLTIVMDGDTISSTSPDGTTLVYTRANTAAEVAAEAKKADAAKAEEDAGWKKKFAVASMTKQPKHVAVGAVPDDKNVADVFDTPDVFTSAQLYLRDGNQEFVYQSGDPPGRYKTYFHWHFLPTGRVYVDAESYAGGVEVPKALRGPLPTYYATGKSEQKKFGKYKVEKDEVVVQMDDGEKVRMELIDGRRNLVWVKAVYGNVVWELEALKRVK